MSTKTNDTEMVLGRRSVRALGLAVLVVLSVFATSGLAGATQASPNTDSDSLESADELYLNDDGSGVLVYENNETDVKEYKLGADVTEGLAHVLIADDVEDDQLNNAEGNLSAKLEDDMFSANGALTMEQPPEVEDLDVQITGEQSAETSEFNADVYALLGSGETGDIQQLSSTTQQASLFESARTSGSIETTADTFRTTGDVSVDFGSSPMATGDSPEETFAFELSEIENGYEVEVSERQTEQAFLTDPAEKWGTKADAKAALEEQYSALADDLGGDVTVEIDHHSFEEQSADTYWKELDYTITYEGIDQLADNLADQLVEDPTTDLEREEAERIAERVTKVEIETVQFDLTSSDEAMDATWTVEINEYAPLLKSAVELSEASMENTNGTDGEDAFSEQLSEFDTRLEAQQAADLRSTFQWNASATYTDNNRVEIEATASGDTENYDAYTDELADRGIDMSNERVVFDFSATTEDGEINVDGNVEIGTEDLAQTALTSFADGIRQEQDAGQLGAFASALEESELEIAKVDLNFDNETVELEAGAKFNSTESLLEDGILGENVVLTQIAGGTEDGGAATYVYVEDPEGEELDQDALAEQGLVDDDTEVYQPGEGDREFAEMDTEAATNYLGVEAGGDGVPGFGPAAGLIGGGIAVALLAARRRV